MTVEAKALPTKEHLGMELADLRVAAIDCESHLGSDGGSANAHASRESASRLPDDTSPAFTVDLSKPLVFQVGHLRENYHQWVHHAIAAKQTPYFFENKFLEFNTRTVWWVVPLLWIPVVCWTQIVAIQRGLAFSKMPTGLLSGVLVWSLIEYLLHRFLFHIKTTGYWQKAQFGIDVKNRKYYDVQSVELFIKKKDSTFFSARRKDYQDDGDQKRTKSNTGHYLLHGCHHKFPLDSHRLVFPPAATSIFCVLFWNVLRLGLPADLAPSVFGGGLLGYVMYDLIHYFLHHGAPFNDLSRRLKRYHLNHHFKEPRNGFGITSSLWDWVFDTLPRMKFS